MTTTLRDVASPAMTVLRNEVEETVGLHPLTMSDERLVIDQVASHQPLRRTCTTEIGVPIPLPGAPGECYAPGNRRHAPRQSWIVRSRS